MKEWSIPLYEPNKISDYLKLEEEDKEIHLEEYSLCMTEEESRLVDTHCIHKYNIVQVFHFAGQMGYMVFNTFSVTPTSMVAVVFIVKYYENKTCYYSLVGVFMDLKIIAI